ncbi:MAG: hypothetical protein IKV94_03775 [Clostridia bacterium]|nr:hypothetical protein [Clostridia bacterium]
MNKNDFFLMLNGALSSLSLEEQVQFVNETIPEWLESYAVTLTKDNGYCYHCHKYSKTTDFSFSEEVITFKDYYHDDELIAKQLVLFKICPKCGNKTKEKLLKSEVIQWL